MDRHKFAQGWHVKLAAVMILSLYSTASWSQSIGDVIDSKAQELVSLRDQSSDGIIQINQKLFQKYALAPDRSYSLIIFLSADYLLDDPRLQLRNKYNEYKYAAQAFSRAQDAQRVFFTVLKFEESEQLFRQLGVQTLPYIVHWGPLNEPRSSGNLQLKEADVLSGQKVQREWKAEEMAKFVVDRTGAAHAEIDRPSFVKSPIFPFVALAVLSAGLYTAWRVYQSPLIKYKPLWVAGALTIYWFSSSGGMYNIIRGMPLYIVNQEKKLQFWLPGRGNQLGAEGFTMGFIYLGASLCMTAITYTLPKWRNSQQRNAAAMLLTITAAFLVYKAFELYKWKAGYWLNIYLP